jgi:RimJ/RimL family protein N-acetyltransferase
MMLRPLTAADEAGYLEAVTSSRAELLAKMPMHKEGESDAAMFARQLRMVSQEQAAGQCFRCIGVLEDGRIAGGFNLNAISRGLEWQCDITWWVATPLTGCGLATEGVSALVDHALGDLPAGLGLHQVHAWITRENEASIRVAKKAGLLRRGEAQSYLDTGASWAVHDKYTRSVVGER